MLQSCGAVKLVVWTGQWTPPLSPTTKNQNLNTLHRSISSGSNVFMIGGRIPLLRVEFLNGPATTSDWQLSRLMSAARAPLRLTACCWTPQPIPAVLLWHALYVVFSIEAMDLLAFWCCCAMNGLECSSDSRCFCAYLCCTFPRKT